ncbi:AbrB/MazE/SpoVT family DNA-binding domain-containing protein [Haloferula sp.]|uniref:AbrB/MazE/SpoVT family DNA-binding domain-containing protein n=1 Tax=Haloferula sp. TaxID=2497595 RepID=UPI003C70EFEC
MTIETKVRKIGNSLGIILPKEALQELNAAEGTSLYLTEGVDGGVKLTVEKPGFKEIMEIAEEGMRSYPNALRELAK